MTALDQLCEQLADAIGPVSTRKDRLRIICEHLEPEWPTLVENMIAAAASRQTTRVPRERMDAVKKEMTL